MEHKNSCFEFCSPSSQKKLLHVMVSFGTGLALALVLQLLAWTAKTIWLRPLSGTPLHYIFIIMTPVMTLFGTISFFYETSCEFDSFVDCAPYVPDQTTFEAMMKLMTFIAHSFFMVRAMVVWTCFWYVELFTTIFTTALFVQDLMALVTQQHLLAFQFLFLHNYYCFEMKDFFSTLVDKYLPRYKGVLKLLAHTCLVTLLFAGSLRLAEEWRTNENFRPKAGDLPTAMKSLFSYLYWVVITISTVGFGDLTPSTTAGQVVIMVIITCSIAWFSATISNLHDFLEKPGNRFIGSSSRVLIVGCKERHQIVDFIDSLKMDKSLDIQGYVNYKDKSVSTMMEQLGLPTIQGVDAKETIRTILCPGQEDDKIIIFRDPTLTSQQSDQYSLDLVKSIRGYHCKATLIVDMTKFISQKLINKVIGWNPKNGICLSLEFVRAHMLALSAHSRLAPALISDELIKQLIFDDSKHSNVKYTEHVRKEYICKNRLVLAAIDDKNEVILMPGNLDHHWTWIILASKCRTKRLICSCKKHKEPDNKKDIRTSAISSEVSILGQPSDVLDQALECHNVIKTDNLQAAAFILNSDKPLDLLKAKQENLGQTRLISTFEHGYDGCCMKGSECVCGTYEMKSLLGHLLTSACLDRRLYDLWMKLISKDYLQAEVIEEDCSYGDLFDQLILRGRVPLGVETMLPKSSCRLPLLNPLPDLKLSQGDTILYMQKTV